MVCKLDCELCIFSHLVLDVLLDCLKLKYFHAFETVLILTLKYLKKHDQSGMNLGGYKSVHVYYWVFK